MANQEIVNQPHLIVSTDDLASRGRIRSIEEYINTDPESFKSSCRYFGGVAIEFMDAETEPPVTDLEAVRAIVPKLRNFLAHNDMVRLEFDDDSDDAIYANSNVKQMISSVQAAKGRVIKQGARSVHLEHPLAVERRDNTTALKLYLYTQRRQAWAGQLATRDGAA